MIQADHLLAVTRRCELLDVARSTVYYRPTGISAEDLALMRLLDEIHLERPFYGSRRLRDELETQGTPVNRKRVQRLVRQMGLRALYPKPRTSQPGVGHTVYPYLLRGLSIERPNQVWATDICYIPMAHGFMYLVAIMDWYSRRVLAWRVSNTFDSDFCVEALEDALTPLRAAGDLQYGPRRPVHVPGVYDGAQDPRGGHQHGRQGTLGRQRVRRASLAQRQIRGCVSPCIRDTRLAPGRTDLLLSVLQRATAS